MDGDLRNMVMSFRVTELQTLLGYAGKNRSGRKNELQARALELVKSKSSAIVAKIKELYRSMQSSMAHQSVGGAVPSGMPSTSYHNSSNGIPQQRLFSASTGYAGSSEKVLQGINSFLSYNGQHKPLSVTMPICPDVKMKRLPFYDIMNELMKPTSLMPQGIGRCQEASHSFCLTPQQAADIAASKEYVAVSLGDQKLQYTVQVQLRFCGLDTSTEQDDQFPPNIVVKVNNKLVPLPHPIPSNRPGVEAKRPSRPLNVTNFVRLSPTITNTVTVQWASDNTKGYVMSLYLVKKLTSTDLLGRLKSKGVRPADFSRGMIKELIAKDDGDCMIAMTSLKVSIACPLGKCKMTLPCRAVTCKHLQCFDANLFLQMNERKPTWMCPVCDKPTLFDNLCIDGYFQEVLGKMASSSSMDVELLPDGSWKPITPKAKKERDECSPPTKKLKSDSEKQNQNQTINLDDDIVIDEDSPTAPKIEPVTDRLSDTEKKKPSGSAEVIDLTISSSEDEEDIPVRPRRKRGNPKYVIDDDTSSSSSSSSSNTSEGSAATRPGTPVAPRSPACITLDSRSPSPEPVASEETNNRNGPGSNQSGSSSTISGNAFSSVNNMTRVTSQPVHPIATSAAASSATTIRSDSRSSSSTTTFDYGHTLGQPSGYPNRSNSSQNQPSISPSLYPSGGGYMPSPYDGQNLWGPPTTANTFPNPFATTPDFSLDFHTMDYINFDPPRGGGSGNYGRWP